MEYEDGALDADYASLARLDLFVFVETIWIKEFSRIAAEQLGCSGFISKIS